MTLSRHLDSQSPTDPPAASQPALSSHHGRALAPSSQQLPARPPSTKDVAMAVLPSPRLSAEGQPLALFVTRVLLTGWCVGCLGGCRRSLLRYTRFAHVCVSCVCQGWLAWGADTHHHLVRIHRHAHRSSSSSPRVCGPHCQCPSCDETLQPSAAHLHPIYLSTYLLAFYTPAGLPTRLPATCST